MDTAREPSALNPESAAAPTAVARRIAFAAYMSTTCGEITLTFDSGNGGMQAHYLSRWVSTSGATGPWSETSSATVAA